MFILLLFTYRDIIDSPGRIRIEVIQMGKREEIGLRIRTMRKSRNMTQEELAKAINQSASSITMYETGRREPDIETLEALADVFNVTLGSIASGESRSDSHVFIPDTKGFQILVRYMPQDDYIMVMEAFDRAYKKAKEAGEDIK